MDPITGSRRVQTSVAGGEAAQLLHRRERRRLRERHAHARCGRAAGVRPSPPFAVVCIGKNMAALTGCPAFPL
jgi:hypothetical protein